MDEINALTAAMQEAGGPWANKRGKRHQVEIKPIYDTNGWADYIFRNEPGFEKRIRSDAGDAQTRKGALREHSTPVHRRRRQRGAKAATAPSGLITDLKPGDVPAEDVTMRSL